MIVFSAFFLTCAHAQPASTGTKAAEIRIAGIIGRTEVELLLPGATAWILTQTNQVLGPRYRLRTGADSRVILRWSDHSVVTFGALTEIEILPPPTTGAGPGLHLIKGILSFFHREEPGRIRVFSRGTVAGVEGTEFVASAEVVNAIPRTTFSVIDGRVALTNEAGALTLTNGQQAVVDAGQAPILQPAGFIANNVLQWCFYYPAVLDLRDLPLTPAERAALDDSLTSYRAGDLPNALANYPAGRQPASDVERIYYGALLLSVGHVEQTEAALAGLPAGDPSDRLPRLANALRRLIAAVKRQVNPSTLAPQLATEFLADSYYQQSRAVRETALRNALVSSRQATTNSPEFGFAWARVAELEFSFGRTRQAFEALNKSLAFSPRNAQALALKGFLLAAQNKTREAIDSFNQAIAVDGALGNAWLGRGLCRIRRGDRPGGREDLLVAAALEPQRALLRSYLGKADGDVGDSKRAHHELALAKNLDPDDPTAWLYSALLLQQENRINEAVGELEHSQELNDNRRLYRSKLLLDQDRAVGSANLANIYRDEGMTDWSVLEAGRAVTADYANYSAHAFLANSYDALRDPNRINLRYETPAESEYLIANLLAPVGAGLLAQSVSQQEYSKLFERDRLGVASTTEYLSRGAWMEHGAQFGTFRNSGYLFEGLYRSDPGQRPNNDFEERELRLHLKQQITPQDSLYFRAIDHSVESGDVFQYYYQTNAYYNPTNPALGLRIRESSEPTLHVGYHHEWSPGVHTLLLAGRLSERFSTENPLQPTFFIIRPPDQPPTDFELMWANLRYRRTLEIYTTELQQICQQGDHTTIVGGRFQSGEFETRSLQTEPVVLGEIIGFFDPAAPAARQRFRSDLERASVYAYHEWQIWPAVNVIGGLAYDQIRFPANFRSPPIADREENKEQVSPKAGLILTPSQATTIRFAYSRALAGASVDQTYLLEPSQVAGFNQSFRSVVPESVGGTGIGAEFETYVLALEHKSDSGGFLGLSGQILNSRENLKLGAFRYTGASFFAEPSSTPESLDYSEKTFNVSLNQLVLNEWSLGVNYRLTYADLQTDLNEVPDTTPVILGVRPREHLSAFLHQVNLQAGYHHRSGFFAQFQALWSQQSNQGYASDIPGDDFWQFNIFAGYQFFQRKAELRLGLLNLTDQDYRLNPLTLHNELPRSRTFAARLQFSF